MKSIKELEDELRQKMEEVYKLRREIDKRKGNEPPPVDFDYEKYVTD